MSNDPMDPSLFQLPATEMLSSPRLLEAPGSHVAANSVRRAASQLPPERVAADSGNLDILRSYAVILVVGFHLAKFFNWRFERLRVTDFGLLGVMFFFVHTTLVLMFSLERQSAGRSSSLFVPFMIRRCFRIYPLAILVVTLAFLFRVPSDLQFGGFNLLHQSIPNFLANLLLIQNVTLQKANPGVLWSLPLELQMYLALPLLFRFASRAKSPWAMIAFWWFVVALWYWVGFSTGTLPLSEGKIRSPIEALLKFTRFAPCFLPGIAAYKLWRLPRLFSAWGWPVFLALCSMAFMALSGSRPIETGWFICLAIGLGVCLFRDMRANSVTWLTKRVARYSYGIYLLHYFAIWLGFAVFRSLNLGVQITIFVTVLTILPILLYHIVEAPLTSAGVRYAEKFRMRPAVFGFAARSAVAETPVSSE
jgi:peptidoglycan/LPS O-acetylase OafA/YrhL